MLRWNAVHRTIGRMLAASTLALAPVAFAAPVIIDDFVDFQAVSIPVGSTPPQSVNAGLNGVSAIGGARNIAISQTAGRTGSSALVDEGVLYTSLGSGAAGTFTVLWDGGTDTTVTPNGLGGVDLTAGGVNDRIVVRARGDTVAPVTVTVYSGNSPFSASFNLPNLGFGAVPFTIFELPFALFGGADFTKIGAIQLLLDATAPSAQGTDAELDIIVASTAIPEPGTLALVLCGLVAGIAIFRRRTSGL